jgi:hypothetical protein
VPVPQRKGREHVDQGEEELVFETEQKQKQDKESRVVRASWVGVRKKGVSLSNDLKGNSSKSHSDLRSGVCASWPNSLKGRKEGMRKTRSNR